MHKCFYANIVSLKPMKTIGHQMRQSLMKAKVMSGIKWKWKPKISQHFNCLCGLHLSTRLGSADKVALNEHLNSIAKSDFPFYSIDWRFKAKLGKPADIFITNYVFTTIIIFHFSIFVTFHSIDTTINVPLLKILFLIVIFTV